MTVRAHAQLHGGACRPRVDGALNHFAPFPEMILAMKRVVALNTELSLEERNLLSVAYKNVIGARRAAWRVVSTIEEQEVDRGAGPRRLATVAEYRGEIEAEVRRICSDLLQLLDTRLLPAAASEESRLFYYKL